jgi:hypothetical protein
VTHSVSGGSVWSVIVLKELASNYWSHKLCQGMHYGDVACYYWVVYIYNGAGIAAKGGVNGGPTIVRPGAVTRVCCYRRRCCYCTFGAELGYMLMVDVQGF